MCYSHTMVLRKHINILYYTSRLLGCYRLIKQQNSFLLGVHINIICTVINSATLTYNQMCIVLYGKRAFHPRAFEWSSEHYITSNLGPRSHEFSKHSSSQTIFYLSLKEKYNKLFIRPFDDKNNRKSVCVPLLFDICFIE